jgi:hypothetical protein
MQRIITLSTALSTLFKILIPITVLSLGLIWVYTPESLPLLQNLGLDPLHGFGQQIVSGELTMSQKYLAFLINGIPTSLTILMMIRALQLFSLYRKMEIFSQNNVMLLASIARLMILRQVIEPLYQALLSPTLTWHNPPGQKLIAIGLNSVNFGLLTLGICLLLVSAIMQEGLKMKTENAAFI